MFRLRRGDYTAIVHFLVDGSTIYRVYRKGLQGMRQHGYVAQTITPVYGFSIAEKGLALAIAEDTAPSTRRPALLTIVPFGRYKYVAYYLRRKGYVDKFPRRQGDAPLVLGEAGTAVVDEVTAHLKAIAPGVVVV